MRYRDIAAAIDWLCAALGFEKHTVVKAETGAVLYAQLTFGNAMLMLAPVRDSHLDRFMKQPDEIGGAETQSCYLVVDDADAHYAKAKAAGAEIVIDIHDDDHDGGRGYSCRDPEGHIWNFGTYDPWQGQQARVSRSRSMGGRTVKRLATALTLLAAICASALAGAWIEGARRKPDALIAIAQKAQDELDLERTAKATAERAVDDLRTQLGRERSASENAKDSGMRAVREGLDLLERERSAKEAAERGLEVAQKRITEEYAAGQAMASTLREVRMQLDQERSAKEGAERAAEQRRQSLIEERNARQLAESAVRQLREQLDRERSARETAERNVEQGRQRLVETQSAKDMAEGNAREAREQLERELKSKKWTWNLIGQLKRQVSQMQSANQSGETSSIAESVSPPAKSARPRPKQRRKATPPDAD